MRRSLLALVPLVALAGCGGSGSTSANPAPNPSSFLPVQNIATASLLYRGAYFADTNQTVASVTPAEGTNLRSLPTNLTAFINGQAATFDAQEDPSYATTFSGLVNSPTIRVNDASGAQVASASPVAVFPDPLTLAPVSSPVNTATTKTWTITGAATTGTDELVFQVLKDDVRVDAKLAAYDGSGTFAYDLAPVVAKDGPGTYVLRVGRRTTSAAVAPGGQALVRLTAYGNQQTVTLQ